MQFPFTFDEKIEGVAVTTYEGEATIAHDKTLGGWFVDTITLDGFDGVRIVDVQLAETHRLYKQIKLHLLQTRADDIEWRWRRYVADCQAERAEIY